MQSRHYFFAVPIPSAIKNKLFEWCDEIKKDYPFKRWVHQEDYHITLAFLGNAEINQLNLALNLMKESLLEISSFRLQINHIGIFGRNETPRIFWAGVHESNELNKLRVNVYEKCIQSGFQLDEKPFRPHITLARKWEQSFGAFSLSSLQEKFTKMEDFNIEEVVLYETVLEAVPKYQKKASIYLGDE
ncbi:RNA 2',3'-cyclic phosphodiesterase [Heyndrickxia oleronia]|uniref:RNA 2',3'-cyclic phosphodiesterase n=1 Tax=Heyndrickxia oleronia TaxID=38875 RepID=UPI001B00902B|nr:RNA 2',3'-cyclic phosphodiesterase [Heyndrickxia oleronia]GIN38827.1 RNA 2',3'-cyclic phosphodiesterase [Heyndrickxia oleronia]